METAATFGMNAHKFCELVGIEAPIVQAPMAGGWTTPDLVAAVANIGGLGMIAAARLSIEQLRFMITETWLRTDRSLGVNFLLAPSEPFDAPVIHISEKYRNFR